MKNKVTAIPYKDRKKILEHLTCVDLVIPEINWEQKKNDILTHDVNIFVMGDDWEGKFDFLSKYCDVHYFKRTDNISSTMIKKHLSSGNDGQLLAATMSL